MTLAFFERPTDKEFHQIFISEQDFKALRYHHSTADKFVNGIAKKDDDGNVVIENDCLVIELEKNYSFTNYETVLEKQSNLKPDYQEKLILVVTWIIDTYKNKGIDDSVKAQKVLRTKESREKWLTDPNIAEMAEYVYTGSAFVNPRLEDLTYLISSRFPRANWTYNDTTKLPMAIIFKFNEFIENENNGWTELKTIEDESLEENLGEFSEPVSAPESTTSEGGSVESKKVAIEM
jgi:hypothetical protein